jgi:hypothetical protein
VPALRLVRPDDGTDFETRLLVHPGEDPATATGMPSERVARLAWLLRLMMVDRYSKEVIQPMHRSMVDGTHFDPHAALYARPVRP